MRQLKPHNILAWVAVAALTLSPLASAKALPSLRILPLGDSITKGSLSSDGNGYREKLRTGLIAYQNGDLGVDMIGTLRDGDMYDRDHEGHSGRYLEDINTYWQKAIQAHPNLVLLHAGTNNMDKNRNIENCPALIKEIIDGVFDAAPETTVLVAPVINSKSAEMNARSEAFNAKLEEMVTEMKKSGRQIKSVPMGIEVADLSPDPDYKHPNDKGYQKMADKWLQAIKEVNEEGWLKDPKDVDRDALWDVGLAGSTHTGGCQGGNWEDRGKVFDDFRVWEEKGVYIPAVEDARRDKVILADLNNDGIADYILADDDGTVRAWINNGSPGDWTKLGKVNPDWSTIKGNMIRMADVTGDGRADLIVLYSDGAAKVWKNTDNGRKFESLDSKWATGLDSREKIHFEDIDGDGLADYVIVYEGGAVSWARNTGNNGKDDKKKNWEDLSAIAPGPAGVPANRASVRDLDGDGKADYLITYEGGAVKALRNTGNLNHDGGRNWDDLGTIAPGVSGVTGNMIRFADVDGDGLADFLAVADDGSIRWWKNLGIVGSRSTSVRFARLTDSKGVDVVFVNPQGRARAWINDGKGNSFTYAGEIATGFPEEDLSAARIEFADVNGDGLDDYLVIYAGGAVKASLNRGTLPNPGNERVWSQPITISEGVGEPGRKVHFAYLDNDAWADFIVIYDGGAVKYWQNNRNIGTTNEGRLWKVGYTVAPGVGEPGGKIRFADITGDGRDEFVVQYDGGAAIAYHNAGNIPDNGQARSWFDMGVIAAGVSRQGPVHYADLNGDGKDDYLVVYSDGSINAWINTCDWQINPPTQGEGGGDGGLDANSTCQELFKAVRDEVTNTIDQKYWDELETTPNWTYWLTYGGYGSKWVASTYAAQWGILNLKCDIKGGCAVPTDCSAYSDGDPVPGTGQAHVILTSLGNLHEYFASLDKAIGDTHDMFNSLSTVLYDHYYPNPTKDVLLSSLFAGIGAILGVGSSLSGSAAAGAGGAIWGALGAAFSIEMSSTDDTLEKEAALDKAAYDWLRKTTSTIGSMNDQLMQHGTYTTDDGKIVLDDLFEDGAWLDAAKIPAINAYDDDEKRFNSTQLADWFFQFLHARVLNFAWRSQVVWVVGCKMSYEEFKRADKIKDELKVYYQGRGYFLQAYRYNAVTFEGIFPPGWDKLSETDPKANFNPTDVILSSVDAFMRGGFGYEGDDAVSDQLEGFDWDEWENLTPRLGGLFNIPLCIDDRENPEEFILDLVHDNFNNNDGCRSFKSDGGKRFWDQIEPLKEMVCDWPEPVNFDRV